MRDLVHLIEDVELVTQAVLVQLLAEGFDPVQLLNEGGVHRRRILLYQLEGFFRVELIEE